MRLRYQIKEILYAQIRLTILPSALLLVKVRTLDWLFEGGDTDIAGSLDEGAFDTLGWAFFERLLALLGFLEDAHQSCSDIQHETMWSFRSLNPGYSVAIVIIRIVI